MSAFGFTSVAANDVTLTASNLPPGQFGIFVTSASSGFIPNPAGSNGNLCLTGSLGRFVSPGQILFIDGTGEASRHRPDRDPERRRHSRRRGR